MVNKNTGHGSYHWPHG